MPDTQSQTEDHVPAEWYCRFCGAPSSNMFCPEPYGDTCRRCKHLIHAGIEPGFDHYKARASQEEGKP